MTTVLQTLDGLLYDLGLDRSCGGGDIFIDEDAPRIATPHRLAAAASCALAAQGAAAAAIWRSRNGVGQDVRVSQRDALNALNSTIFLRQNGKRIGMGVAPHEPMTPYLRVRDGWFKLVGSRPGLRDRTLKLLNCPNTAEAIAAAVSSWNGVELENACAEVGVSGAFARTPPAWRAHPQGAWLAGLPVVQIEKIADSSPRPLSRADRPLAGVRVLEAAHILAGPAASRTLAEHGAEVLRISHPVTPQDPPYMVIDTGFGKRNAFLDLDLADDRHTFARLAAGADVFVESFRAGALSSRGLSGRELALAYPGLIHVSVTCYGDGPWDGRRGFDPNAQTVTGVSLTQGRMQAPRNPPTGLLADFLTGFLAAAGAQAALLRRAREGGSYQVKVSLARTCMWVQDLGLLPEPEWLDGPTALDLGTRTVVTQSPFGDLSHLPPATRLSRTPATWSGPPCPMGAHRAQWAGAHVHGA